MNRKMRQAVCEEPNASSRKLICASCLFGVFLGFASVASSGDSSNFMTETAKSATLPWKVHSLVEMIDLWKLTSLKRTHWQTLLAWTKQRNADLAKVNHLDVLVELPTRIQPDAVIVLAKVKFRQHDGKLNLWKPSSAEARLIEAVVKRAKVICHCTNLVALEIAVQRFYFTPFTASNGEPAVSFCAIFNEEGQRYEWTLQLFLSFDRKWGTNLPGMKLKALRDAHVNGTNIPDDSKIIDGWEGFFHDVGGNIRSENRNDSSQKE
jgi:hypothetical protein